MPMSDVAVEVKAAPNGEVKRVVDNTEAEHVSFPIDFNGLHGSVDGY